MAIDEKVLIERLEKNKAYNEEMLAEFPNMGTVEHEIYKLQRDTYKRAIEIVKDLAEEHNNGFCEWAKTNVGGMKLIREPHRMYLFKERDDEWEYCPYCGKKIKVLEKQQETWKQQTMRRFERVE